MPIPTFGWEDLPDYKGMVPGQAPPPERVSLLQPGIEGEKLCVTGHVLTRSGAPIIRAKLDFWHADRDGKYDLHSDYFGYRLRGVQFTDKDSEFSLTTTLPGRVGGQVRHINYIAAAFLPNRKQQLYLRAAIYLATEEELGRAVASADRPFRRPGAKRNRDDSAFLALAALPLVGGVRHATYDIVFDIV